MILCCSPDSCNCQTATAVQQLHMTAAWLLQLRIEGEGLRHVELSLNDLRTKFKRHSVAAAMQCSGNRRHDMTEVKNIQGLDWDIGECIGRAEALACLLDIWAGSSTLGELRQALGYQVHTAAISCLQAGLS